MQMEALFDKHYQGLREVTAVKRSVALSIVQEVHQALQSV
ncbi:hypothetical protein QFZ80_002807 [Paenibacillus sp. V4I7]|nr:hypothetical protein [Paenibacillus sp. V4I7]